MEMHAFRIVLLLGGFLQWGNGIVAGFKGTLIPSVYCYIPITSPTTNLIQPDVLSWYQLLNTYVVFNENIPCLLLWISKTP